MKHNYLIIVFLGLISWKASAQLTTTQVDEWIQHWPYTDVDKKDSMLVWSNQLMNASKVLNYPRAEAYALRFKGLYHDYDNNPTEAIKYYFEFLKKTKVYENVSDQMSATSDLVYIYMLTNQLDKAKPLLLSFTGLRDKTALDPKKLSSFYNNLGVIYRKEDKKDSAILAYQASLTIKEKLKDEKGLTNLRINLSSLLVNQQKYTEALKLTEQNLRYLQKNENKTDLWYNLVNKAASLDGLKRYDECIFYLNEALALAKSLKSETFEQQTIEQISGTYANQKQFADAFEYLRKSNELKSQLINKQTNEKIAELQEQHNAEERERQNQLLNSQLEAQKNKQAAYGIGLAALLIVAGVSLTAYLKNLRKNKLIIAQNQKLNELNTEKNQLMAIVSHDLSSPFTAIRMWANTLNENSKNTDLAEAKEMILKISTFGLSTIQKILTIDKGEIDVLNLQDVDIADLLKNLHERFKAEAEQKNIALKIRALQEKETILADKNLLERALQNLVSNAIKFSHADSEVYISTYQHHQEMIFEVKDFGVGISEHDQGRLFERYNELSTKPTGVETSNGLGLSIVKRIAEELGGTISVQSSLGAGSTFCLKLKDSAPWLGNG
jgi:signal transduction histidine kinase